MVRERGTEPGGKIKKALGGVGVLEWAQFVAGPYCAKLMAELVADPHLNGCDCLVTVEHPEAGQNTFVAPPWKLSATPAGITRHAPMVGRHNEYISCELLGMPEEEFAVLVGEQVIY